MSASLLPVASGPRIRGYLGALMRRRWRWLGVTVVMMVVDSVLGLVGPIAIGWITQAVADHRPASDLVGPVALLGLTALAGGVTGWAAAVLLARVVLPAVAGLREDAVAAALRLPIDTVEAGGGGDLVSRVSGDVEKVSDAATEALGEFVGAVLTILVTLAGLAALDWRFAVAGLLAVPVQAHTLRWYLRTSRPIYAAGRVADGRRASALLAGYTGLPTLRALRLGPRQRTRIEAASRESMECEFQAIRTATRFYGRLNLAEYIGLGSILLVAFLLVRAEEVTIGAATTAALFFAGLFGPINTALGVFDGIQQAGAGLARLIGVTTAHRDEPAAAAPVPRQPAAVVASGVRFGYRDNPDVLHDIDLVLAPGERLAIVGTTGSGKSTLASLLAGLRRPRAGAITIDGVPAAELDGHAGQLDGQAGGRRIALVAQETHVFAGTIADNLRLARPGATPEEISAALATVEADRWIAALPDGTETFIGSGGTQVTADQAQQLALARLVLLDADLVILDEATAEGGSDAARTLDRAARTVTDGRTAVVIAHRLSQTATADRILVLESGRIIEQGSHQELHAAGGIYAGLWDASAHHP